MTDLPKVKKLETELSYEECKLLSNKHDVFLL